jgi:hypothetical protein
MKKIRGFVDPITLGFLIIAIGTGAAVSSTSKTEKQVVKQTTQEPIVQVQAMSEDHDFFN